MQVNYVSAPYDRLTQAANNLISALTQPRKMPIDNFTDAITAAYNVRSLATDVMMRVNVAAHESRTRDTLVSGLF